jgi:predicted RNA-binding protein with PUA-like domain
LNRLLGHANITWEIQFSVDDFERVGTSPWEGVRNYEARNLMKEMAVGEKVDPFKNGFINLTE